MGAGEIEEVAVGAIRVMGISGTDYVRVARDNKSLFSRSALEEVERVFNPKCVRAFHERSFDSTAAVSTSRFKVSHRSVCAGGVSLRW